MNHTLYVWTGIFLMALTTYLIRAMPMILFRKPIENPFVQSFLYYVPYAVLSAMTFPAVFNSDVSLYAVAAGVLTACIAAWKNCSLIIVAAVAAVTVYAVSLCGGFFGF